VTGDNRQAADEQAALRRLAVLVAQSASPDEVFAATTEEARRLLGVSHAMLSRYDADAGESVVAAWSGTTGATPAAIGTRVPIDGRNVTSLVFQTGQETRLADYADVSGAMARVVGQLGLHEGVGAPIHVEGRLWGVMVVASTKDEPLPADTGRRLSGFTELAAIAIANTQARAALRGFADEQAALRRVATLVARGEPPRDVFMAVSEEAGRLLSADITGVARYDPGGTATAVGHWTRTTDALSSLVGTSVRLGGQNVMTLVHQTGQPARIDAMADGSGEPATIAVERGHVSVVGVPITVEDRLWGVLAAASSSAEPLPPTTEERLTAFTGLAAIAIADAQARSQLSDFADEQAALRRVATLVATETPPDEVFTAVTAEAGQLVHADYMVLTRNEPNGMITVIGVWGQAGTGQPLPVGRRLETDAFAGAVRDLELHASVSVPIWVEGRLWGAMMAGSRSEPLPVGTEGRLSGFTVLAATALANAEAQAALRASRARIVAAADQTRRRVERDLHDGAQQRLVSMALRLRAIQATLPPATEQPGSEQMAERLDAAVAEAVGLQEELREISHGLYPAVLAESGLRSALRALARRSAIPVSVEVRLPVRLAEPVEFTAYYAVAETLSTVARYAHASAAEVEATADDGVLRIEVRDDGLGGADFTDGSGLTSVRDRVEAFGGRISLRSPRGAGTTMEIILPLDDGDSAR
jgi:signal transduction histidine kinase